MSTAIITDHSFPSIHLQQRVFASAGLELVEIKPNCVTEDDVVARCKGAGALLVQWAPITRQVLAALPEVQGVVRYGIGVNNIDLEAARSLGINVANVPTYCIEEVSNHAMAMILSLMRRIPHDHYRITHGEWGIGPFLPIAASADMTLGLVGFGTIARRVAEKAKQFGFHIIASDPFVPEAVFARYGVTKESFEDLMRIADIVSLHCPLVPETEHLLNSTTIAGMKDGAIIVNTSRGPIIQEDYLVAALRSGKLAGAGLDVFEIEPLPKDSPLRKLPNVILTSHAASVSSRAVEALQIKAAEAARDLLLGKRPEGALVWAGL